MGLLDTLKTKTVEAGVQLAIDQLKDAIINPNIKDYGTITSLRYQDKTLFCTLTLLGLEHEVLEVSCSSIQIAEDASSITLSGFTANKAFLENALNQFAAKPIQIPDNPTLRTGIKLLKKVVH